MIEQIPDVVTLWGQLQEWGIKHVTDNDFLVAGIFAAIVMVARNIPARMYHTIRKLVTIEISANTDDQYFVKFNEFLSNKVIVPWFQRRHLFRIKSNDYRSEDSDKNIKDSKSLSPGYGWHIGWYKGRPAFIHRKQHESDSKNFKETVEVTLVGRSKSRFTSFIEDALSWVDQAKNKSGISVYRHQTDYWYEGVRLPKRSLSTIFMNTITKTRVVDFLKQFIDREEWYINHGVPYHTGIFLYGEPGCGKSSFIHALASQFNKDVYYLNLGAIQTDATLVELLQKEWNNAILVIEDIDAMGKSLTRDSADKSDKLGSLTISGLLNALDGLTTPHGMIVIATTNHIDTIDPALLRKGRFDLKVEIGRLDYNQFIAMGNSFGFDMSFITEEHYLPLQPVAARNLFIENAQDTIQSSYEEIKND